jgi:DNA polymerase-3 subunit chi
MAELWFYHLERSSLEKALAPLLEKCLSRGWRALVRGTASERLIALDDALWRQKPEGFLPHGLEAGEAPSRQPILLTLNPGNPNGAKALFLVDGAGIDDAGGFARASVLFDGANEEALARARAQWKEAKGAGFAVTYFKEMAPGRWEQQA